MTQLWPAPAKLNLFLHITGRRADDYHTLQTLFQFIDLADQLHFDVTPDGRITRAHVLPGVPAEKDLCLRAAQLLQAASGCSQGAIIHLDKRLPVGGGLGGGSSDAATTLIALNELWQCGLTRSALATLGLTLGADVPVFVGGQASWAEGVGEILTPADPPETWFVLLAPPVLISTAQVFAAFAREHDLTPYRAAITIRDFRAGQSHNDLEPVVRRLYPEVDNALKWLGDFGDARMTGSGACIFLPVPGQAAGQAIVAQCPQQLAEGFVVRGLNRHPLHPRLKA